MPAQSATRSPTATAALPGFDFLHKLAQGGAASWAQWVAPTLDAQALDKRIEELKAVQFWLDQNAAALKATIQALEVQKMTLATLKSMNVPLAWPAAAGAAPATAASAAAAPQQAPAAQPQPRPKRARAPRQQPTAATTNAATAQQTAPLADPLQLWGALAQQFQQIAAQAMQEAAGRKAPATTTRRRARG